MAANPSEIELSLVMKQVAYVGSPNGSHAEQAIYEALNTRIRDQRNTVNAGAIVCIDAKSSNQIKYKNGLISQYNNAHSEILALLNFLRSLNINNLSNKNNHAFILDNVGNLKNYKIFLFTERTPCNLSLYNERSCDSLLRELAFQGVAISVYYAIPHNYKTSIDETLRLLLPVAINAHQTQTKLPSIVTRCIDVKKRDNSNVYDIAEDVEEYKSKIILRDNRSPLLQNTTTTTQPNVTIKRKIEEIADPTITTTTTTTTSTSRTQSNPVQDSISTQVVSSMPLSPPPQKDAKLTNPSGLKKSQSNNPQNLNQTTSISQSQQQNPFFVNTNNNNPPPPGRQQQTSGRGAPILHQQHLHQHQQNPSIPTNIPFSTTPEPPKEKKQQKKEND